MFIKIPLNLGGEYMNTVRTTTKRKILKYQTEVTELQNTIKNWKNIQQGLNNRLDGVEERISYLVDRAVALTQTEQQKEWRILKSENSLRGLWDKINWNNICIIVFQEEESKRGAENLFEEMMVGNFPNLGMKIDNRFSKPREFQTR